MHLLLCTAVLFFGTHFKLRCVLCQSFLLFIKCFIFNIIIIIIIIMIIIKVTAMISKHSQFIIYCRRLLSVIFCIYNMFYYLCILILVAYNNYYTFKYYSNINAPTYPQIRLLYKEYFYKRTLTHL